MGRDRADLLDAGNPHHRDLDGPRDLLFDFLRSGSFDLAEDLDNQTFDEIHRALLAHHKPSLALWQGECGCPSAANSGGERFEVSGLYRFGDFYYATGQLISPWTWLPDGRDVGRVMLTYRSPTLQLPSSLTLTGSEGTNLGPVTRQVF